MNTTDTWYCDTCNDKILDPAMALVVWEVDREPPFEKSNFRIVHKGKRCDTVKDDYSVELDHALGIDGQAFFLSLLSAGPLFPSRNISAVKNLDEFVDTFRRTQFPGYEEARRYMTFESVRDHFGDANEEGAYTEHSIARIIELGRTELEGSA